MPHNGTVQHDQIADVLEGWAGRAVTVVAFVEPGVSLRPFLGLLRCERAERHTTVAVLEPDGTRIAFPAATFHEAGWVPGREGSGLTVVQGATRVDVFLED